MLFKPRVFFPALFLVLLAGRLCHSGVLWAEEGLPLAAAAQMLHGRMLYSGIWFDKPPLLAAVYLLWGAHDGWVLRLAGALYALLACALAYRFARDLWSEWEGFWAAALLGFFLVFDIPSAVIPLASDLLMLVPHLAAVWLAWKRRPFSSGTALGVAFLISPKAVIVGAVCLLWYPAGVLWLAAGFAAVNGVAVLWLWAGGALQAYWQEVWLWGRLYAAAPLGQSPWANGALRTVNWTGFHLALVVAAGWFLIRRIRHAETVWQWLAWCLLCLCGVALGGRFFPRYYFLLLPPMVLMAARGLHMLGRKRDLIALLLLIPLTRFGPRYVMLAAGDAGWTDTAMDRDSRRAAGIVRRVAPPGASLQVWGFRPELYVYTGLPAATRYLDSQPLTGVPADRHLTEADPVEREGPGERRAELARSQPQVIVDGLGLYNPRLAISRYRNLRAWLSAYREAGRSGQSVIYVLRNPPLAGTKESGPTSAVP